MAARNIPPGHHPAAWEQRLLILESTEPIAFRRQNFGDYEIPSLHLKEGLESGPHGFRAARARLTGRGVSEPDWAA